jgi:hypothetical protein
LRQFLGDRLGVDGQTLTPQEINNKLANTRIPDHTGTRLNAILQTLEQGAFGSLRQDIGERKAIFGELDTIVQQVIRWT